MQHGESAIKSGFIKKPDKEPEIEDDIEEKKTYDDLFTVKED